MKVRRVSTTTTLTTTLKSDKNFGKCNENYRKIVLTPLVLFCLSTLVLLALIPVLQLLPLNFGWICRNNFLSKRFDNVLFCKTEITNNLNRGNNKWLKGTIPSPSYFYEPFPSDDWGLEENEVISSNFIFMLKSFLEEIIFENYEPYKRPSINPFLEAEAIAALEAGKKFRNKGNLHKAKTIVEHAYSMAPNNPDILTEYGIIMETVHNDIVLAEGYYRKALTHDPRHTEALIRRAKTLPMVIEFDQKMLKKIHRKREEFSKIPRTDPALKRAMRNYI